METIDNFDALHLPRRKGTTVPLQPSRWHSGLFTLLASWEIYPIICIAIFLRFYHVGLAELDADQAEIFAMARTAIEHGLIPVTTNRASIGIINPPATVYLLMLGAFFSANPLAGVVVTALLNVLAVLLTYVLVRRYYGRIAASTAASLYAVAQMTVFYSRFMWNQNMLAPFVLLFLMALFWGVVERRKGWFAPAVLLWGWMIQLHGSAVYLVVPLVCACLLAWRTLRWRDCVIAAGLLIVIYAPYIVWEVETHFSDVPVLLQSLHNPSVTDNQALKGYLTFLTPYLRTPQEIDAWQYKLYPMLRIGHLLTVILTLLAFAFALCPIVFKRWPLVDFIERGQRHSTSSMDLSTSWWGSVRAWYREFLATPWRGGILLLLVWQIVPLLLLSRHSTLMFNYYVLILMPGPFILLGLLAAQIAVWLKRRPMNLPRRLLSVVCVVALFGLILMQGAGTWSWIVDDAQGHYQHPLEYHNTEDLQYALGQADQIAQSRHLKHIYIGTDIHTNSALQYLAKQMHTPYTLFSADVCMILPGVTQGQALVFLGPEDQTAQHVLTQFASTQLLEQPARLVHAQPYRLYLVQPSSSSQPPLTSFTNDFELKGILSQTNQLMVTRWNILRTAPQALDTFYYYRLNAHYSGNGLDGQSAQANCFFNRLQPGEQLLAAFSLPQNQTLTPQSFTLDGIKWTSSPYYLSVGPFTLETQKHQESTSLPLKATNGTGIPLSG